MSQHGPEGGDPPPEVSGSSLGWSGPGGSSDGSSLDDAREAADREQRPADPFSRPANPSPEWPGYPPAAAPEPPPVAPQYGTPQYGTPQYGTPQYGTPQYEAPQQGSTAFGAPEYGGAAGHQNPQGYPTTPEYGYPATPEYGSSPYEVNPYQSSYGGYSPYGFGAALTPHPQSTPALVMGIVGVTVCPLVGIGGLVLGNRARREIDAQPSRYTGRGQATAGWVLGIISIVFSVLWVLFVALGVSGAFD